MARETADRWETVGLLAVGWGLVAAVWLLIGGR